MPIPRRILALLVALVALTAAPRVFATSCEVPQLESSRDRADVIFLGSVVGETPIGGGAGLFRFRVDRVFKGAVPATVTVSGGGMKGSSFTVGHRYLVFGRLPEMSAVRPPDLFAHLCGGTQAAERVTDWISALGAGTAPTDASAPIVAGPRPQAPDPPAPSSESSVDTQSASSAGTVQHVQTGQPSKTPGGSGGCAGCTVGGAGPITPNATLVVLVLLFCAPPLRCRKLRRSG